MVITVDYFDEAKTARHQKKRESKTEYTEDYSCSKTNHLLEFWSDEDANKNNDLTEKFDFVETDQLLDISSDSDKTDNEPITFESVNTYDARPHICDIEIGMDEKSTKSLVWVNTSLNSENSNNLVTVDVASENLLPKPEKKGKIIYF